MAVASGARRSALLPATLLALALAVGVTTLLGDSSSFALPLKRQPKTATQNPQLKRPHIRNTLESTYEIPLEEPPAPELEKPTPRQQRLPYALQIYTHTPTGHKGLNEAHREYILDKVKAALANTQDWIEKVKVIVTVDHNAHKAAEKRDDTRHVLEESDRPMKGKKRELAPFMIEAMVYLHGRSVMLSSPKHAQATLGEAVDHMYDFLRRQMRKEKERRVDARRKQQKAAMEVAEVLSAYSDEFDALDYELMALNDEAEAKMDREAEELYKLVEK